MTEPHAIPPRAPRILVADDDPAVLRSLSRFLESEGYEVVTADGGREALSRVRETSPDLVLTDVMMPGVDGLEVCRTLKATPSTRLVPVIMVTGLSASDDKIRGIEAGADDFLSKPFDVQELRARVRSLTRLKQFTDELEQAETVLFALARAIEGRDPYTQGHCERLSEMGGRLGARLDLPEEDIVALRRGGTVHDLGKVVVPDSVLLKPGRLDEEEWRTMRRHPLEGERIVRDLRSFQRVLPIVRSHHEKGDGSGYPDGLGEDDIPFLARVLQVVDVYDALTTARPYKRAQAPEAALAILEEEALKGWWDRDVVEVFGRMIMEGSTPRHQHAKTTRRSSVPWS